MNKSFWEWLWNDPPMDIRMANIRRKNKDGEEEEIVAWRIKSGSTVIDIGDSGIFARKKKKKLIEIEND